MGIGLCLPPLPASTFRGRIITTGRAPARGPLSPSCGGTAAWRGGAPDWRPPPTKVRSNRTVMATSLDSVFDPGGFLCQIDRSNLLFCFFLATTMEGMCLIFWDLFFLVLSSCAVRVHRCIEISLSLPLALPTLASPARRYGPALEPTDNCEIHSSAASLSIENRAPADRRLRAHPVFGVLFIADWPCLENGVLHPLLLRLRKTNGVGWDGKGMEGVRG